MKGQGGRNPFEELGRARKVSQILAAIPVGSTPAANARTAEWLEQLEQVDRDRLMAHAGIKPRRDGSYASAETWRQVCAGARGRRLAS